jgi:hypothetical protein
MSRTASNARTRMSRPRLAPGRPARQASPRRYCRGVAAPGGGRHSVLPRSPRALDGDADRFRQHALLCGLGGALEKDLTACVRAQPGGFVEDAVARASPQLRRFKSRAPLGDPPARQLKYTLLRPIGRSAKTAVGPYRRISGLGIIVASSGLGVATQQRAAAPIFSTSCRSSDWIFARTATTSETPRT